MKKKAVASKSTKANKKSKVLTASDLKKVKGGALPVLKKMESTNNWNKWEE